MTDLAAPPPLFPPAPPAAGPDVNALWSSERAVPSGRPPNGLDEAPLRPPVPGRLLLSDVAAALVVFFVLVVGTWVRHGGFGALQSGGTEAWRSLTQVSGLLASAVGLVGLALVARPRAIERRYGLDRVFVWHKWLGGTMAVLVIAHVLTSLAGWAADLGWWTALVDLTGREPYMAQATVGFLLLVVVALTSLRPARRRLSYETWYLVHLVAYAALALSFAHQVVLGGDFSSDPVAWWFWVGVHLAVCLALVVGRWGRLLVSYLRPLRIAGVTTVAPGTVELRLTGRRLRKMQGDAGQFALLRPLVPRLWWQAHPYSLSAVPTSDGLVFTVKERGDASGALARLPVGTRVAVEGPYGALTPAALSPDRRLLLVVGGVGVAPARALLQRLSSAPIGQAPLVLYRARHRHELVHLAELRTMAERRGGRVVTLVGRRDRLPIRDPFSADALLAVAPDLRDRQVFVCGPEELCAATRRGLRRAGVPSAHVHYDRCWW